MEGKGYMSGEWVGRRLDRLRYEWADAAQNKVEELSI